MEIFESCDSKEKSIMAPMFESIHKATIPSLIILQIYWGFLRKRLSGKEKTTNTNTKRWRSNCFMKFHPSPGSVYENPSNFWVTGTPILATGLCIAISKNSLSMWLVSTLDWIQLRTRLERKEERRRRTKTKVYYKKLNYNKIQKTKERGSDPLSKNFFCTLTEISGTKGGVILLFASASQSMSAKNSCSFISSASFGPHPSLRAGSLVKSWSKIV